MEFDNKIAIKDIRGMKAAGRFNPYIEQVIFPHFKNLERGLSITFDFPVTALVGQNGTNKSSVLRALQACPGNNSISDYWFDTDLDYIENEPNDRQRYIHKFKVPSGNMAEVIKIRIQKVSRGKDYFETAKPRKKDGMHSMPEMIEADAPFRVATRWRPIDKDVVYIDFRAQLPAFDILMCYQNRKSKRDAAQRKALVRLRSRRLEDAFHASTPSIVLCGTERLLSDVIDLSEAELCDVSRILGRKYNSIKLVKHDLFEYEGWTAKLITSDLFYSEAFAGSGEFAAISIVHALYQANEGSLVLLDEPETSLHPGAQKALCDFLLKMCKQKAFQIVMATHSREIICELPSEGRKLLGVLPNKSCVSLISSSASLEEAFARLGADYPNDSVFVEDDLAAELVRVAFRKKGADAVNSVSIKAFPGGAQTIKTRLIPILAEINSNALVVLDGDQRPDFEMPVQLHTPEECSSFCSNFGMDLKFIPMNGGNDKSPAQQLKQVNKILSWINHHVLYLPGADPEGLLLTIVDGLPIEDESVERSSSENKEEWVKRAREAYSKCDGESISSDEIISYQRIALNRAFNDEENNTAKAAAACMQVIVDRLLNSGSPLSALS